MSIEKLDLPADLRDFLSAERNRTLRWGRPYPVEVEEATFFSIDELSLQTFELCTYEYYLNHGEPGENPDLCYPIVGFDIIKTLKGYTPEGILVWFPRFSEYGAWDSDHWIITMMPGLTWADIQADAGKYVNAQWYPERVNHYLLRPWADSRCNDLVPRKFE
jgi:hypothetical protein